MLKNGQPISGNQYRWAQAVWNRKKAICRRRADQGGWSV